MLSERRANALASINHLWKTENQAWVKERKELWKSVKAHFDGDPADYVRDCRRFFLEGKQEGYIAEVMQFVMTPFNSESDILSILESGLFDAREVNMVCKVGMINKLSDFYGDSELSIKMTEVFLQSVVEPVYFGDGLSVRYQEKEILIDKDPEVVFERFCISIKRILMNKTECYLGLNYIDYFIQLLDEYRSKLNRELVEKSFNEMYELIDEATSLIGKHKFSDYALETLKVMNSKREQFYSILQA